jgi:hypothetical protein
MRRRGLDQLRYFVAFVDGLEKRHDFAQLGSTLDISYTPTTGLKAEIERPDEHLFRSLLIDARRLFTKGEDTDLEVVLITALDHVTDAAARKAITDPAQHYRQLRAHGDQLQLVVNGETMRPAALVDLWIQGTLFHGDSRKETRLTELMSADPITARLIENQVLSFVNRIVYIAIWVASVIRHEDAAGRLH